MGRNITFSSKLFSFERGLELLRSDMVGGIVEAALIGGVDEASFSKEQFEAKFSLPHEDYAMVEGSCWLLIKTRSERALGKITSVASFADFSRTLAWLEKQTFDRPVRVAYGILMAHEEKEAVHRTLPDAVIFDFIGAQGYFDSAAACAVTTFLQSNDAACLVHINKDTRGQFVVMRVEKD